VTDKVSEVYEKYSHNGDLSSYVQTCHAGDLSKPVTARLHRSPSSSPNVPRCQPTINAALQAKLLAFVRRAGDQHIDMRNFEFSESYMATRSMTRLTQEQLRLAAEKPVADS